MTPTVLEAASKVATPHAVAPQTAPPAKGESPLRAEMRAARARDRAIRRAALEMRQQRPSRWLVFCTALLGLHFATLPGRSAPWAIVPLSFAALAYLAMHVTLRTEQPVRLRRLAVSVWGLVCAIAALLLVLRHARGGGIELGNPVWAIAYSTGVFGTGAIFDVWRKDRTRALGRVLALIVLVVIVFTLHFGFRPSGHT